MSTLTIDSSRFGTLEIPADDVIEFPAGLIGLGGTPLRARRHRRRARSAGCTRSTTRRWRCRSPNPWHFFSDYEVELSDEAAAADHRRRGRRRRLRDGPRRRASSRTSPPTCARRSSIAEGRGHQVINEAADAPVRAPLFPAVAAAA